jgi:mRNA-degrading endonuclease YafQ of YafQ-DinJ toxin-antitoxin module
MLPAGQAEGQNDMLSISRTARFKRDYKSLSRSVSGLDAMLAEAVDRLAKGKALPDRYKDHPLIGTGRGSATAT